MSWLIKFPVLSLCLVFATYSVFGWNVGNSAASLTHVLVEQGESWGWLLKDDLVFLGLHILAGIVVLVITTSLIAPVAIITIVFGSGFTSDNRAMIAVLLWSFAIVLMFSWLTYFVRLLVLLCAAVLGKLQLQSKGYPQWQVITMLIIICLGGFASGLAAFYLKV
ncbi:MAG TPA: hypothetical protein DCF68_05960 [Cyanothece sp. UBA12306]|nr:hypothetical protein [Cyanothece sp. UBA12306]